MEKKEFKARQKYGKRSKLRKNFQSKNTLD